MFSLIPSANSLDPFWNGSKKLSFDVLLCIAAALILSYQRVGLLIHAQTETAIIATLIMAGCA
jgi:hypothetical protein